MKRSARMLAGLGFLFVAWAYAPSALRAVATDVGAKCMECHAKAMPNVVNDGKLSEHSSLGIACETSAEVERGASEIVLSIEVE